MSKSFPGNLPRAVCHTCVSLRNATYACVMSRSVVNAALRSAEATACACKHCEYKIGGPYATSIIVWCLICAGWLLQDALHRVANAISRLFLSLGYEPCGRSPIGRLS